MSDRRSAVAYVRVTEADKARLVSLAASYGISLSEYLAAAGLGRTLTEIKPLVIPEPNKKKWQELSRMAANLNQLAHGMNAGKIINGSSLELENLKREVRLLRLALLGAVDEG